VGGEEVRGGRRGGSGGGVGGGGGGGNFFDLVNGLSIQPVAKRESDIFIDMFNMILTY